MTNNKEKEGGFISHLTELRQRLINSLILAAPYKKQEKY